MVKQNTEPNENTLHVKRGEKIEFPVEATHPLARFQKLTPVRSLEDISEFLKAWTQVGLEPTQTLVDRLKEAEVKVLRVATNDLRIEAGAVVTLSNPVNQLDFDNVTIAGDLVARGELILTCNTLTIR